jgi:DNA-binding CsgD family transcriptional regulator
LPRRGDRASIVSAVQTMTDPVAAGQEALARGAWSEARIRFETALDREECAEAWEGLGWVGLWLHDADLTLRARGQAYRAYRRRGEAGAAGRIAAWLAADFHELRGDHAIARGWLERAHRLLDDLAVCADHGWLALIEGSFTLDVVGDLDGAGRIAGRAARLGRELAVADLEAIGLALEGLTLVMRAQVEPGMRRLDEAAAIATGEDAQSPIVRSWALCYVVAACERVGDFPRAAQWGRVMRESTDRWGARQVRGACRGAYGTVLSIGGHWRAAEAELLGALDDLQAARPGMAAGALARLGELRVRQGRTEEARALFERAGNHPLAVVGVGALALDGGDAAAAADCAERVLRRTPSVGPLDCLPALELLVRARADIGEIRAAAGACADLERLAAELGTPYVRGRARLVAGELAATRGAQDEARRACEDALDDFVEAGAPYDAARARLALARALAALRRPKRPAAEARGARETFAALGAEQDAARAEAQMLDDASRRSLDALTPRELEILRLVAQGLCDAQIAHRLVLSPHTVHRHVANMRVKLRLPSRAAAVAYAAHAGLL